MDFSVLLGHLDESDLRKIIDDMDEWPVSAVFGGGTAVDALADVVAVVYLLCDDHEEFESTVSQGVMRATAGRRGERVARVGTDIDISRSVRVDPASVFEAIRQGDAGDLDLIEQMWLTRELLAADAIGEDLIDRIEGREHARSVGPPGSTDPFDSDDE